MGSTQCKHTSLERLPELTDTHYRCTNCGSFVDRGFYFGWEAGKEAERDRIRELEAQLAELSNLFELRWKRDVEAVSKWQAAGTGRELSHPDRADLVVFLLEMMEDKDRKLAKANELIGNPIRKSGWWGLPNITIKACGPRGEVMAVPEPGYIINEHGEVKAARKDENGGH